MPTPARLPISTVWTTPDPIGIIGGINLYSYVSNNPVNRIDPLGLLESAGELGIGNPGSYGGENTEGSMYGSEKDNSVSGHLKLSVS